MGFHIEVNSILRSDAYRNVSVGDLLPFMKEGSRIFFDDIPIWLTNMDWTALAEIQIVSQIRNGRQVEGEFEVLHVYEGEEKKIITDVFRRMYADQGDPYVYVLMSPDTLQESTRAGVFAPESLESEGFVHASPSEQLTRIANKHYHQFDTVHVAIVCKKKVSAPIKWEPATGGLYPHIYGELSMESVERTIPFSRDGEAFDIKLNLPALDSADNS